VRGSSLDMEISEFDAVGVRDAERGFLLLPLFLGVRWNKPRPFFLGSFCGGICFCACARVGCSCDLDNGGCCSVVDSFVATVDVVCAACALSGGCCTSSGQSLGRARLRTEWTSFIEGRWVMSPHPLWRTSCSSVGHPQDEKTGGR